MDTQGGSRPAITRSVVRPLGRINREHGTGPRPMEILMTNNQVRYAVRLQKAAEKKQKLTYRGVAYLLLK